MLVNRLLGPRKYAIVRVERFALHLISRFRTHRFVEQMARIRGLAVLGLLHSVRFVAIMRAVIRQLLRLQRVLGQSGRFVACVVLAWIEL